MVKKAAPDKTGLKQEKAPMYIACEHKSKIEKH